MLGEWISRRWPLKWRSERTERGGSGKWKLGQVRVTKHGIYTLPFQRRGQARCMWAGPCICIRRILRMWDPAMVRNPMQDPSLPAIQCQWWGVCRDVSILDGMFDWLITASLGKVLRVYLELFKVGFFGRGFLRFLQPSWNKISPSCVILEIIASFTSHVIKRVTKMPTSHFLTSCPARGSTYVSWFIAFWWDMRSSWFIPVACNRCM